MTRETLRAAAAPLVLDRRKAGALILSAVGAGLAGPASAAGKAKSAEPAAPMAHKELVAATKKCVEAGEICLNHCIRLTKLGDKSIAKCMEAVRAMLPVCGALGKLASLDAKRLKELAKVCADVCSDCEDECRKHEFHHRECKACAEACAATVREVKKLLT